jgi:hypothetical protein
MRAGSSRVLLGDPLEPFEPGQIDGWDRDLEYVPIASGYRARDPRADALPRGVKVPPSNLNDPVSWSSCASLWAGKLKQSGTLTGFLRDLLEATPTTGGASAMASVANRRPLNRRPLGTRARWAQPGCHVPGHPAEHTLRWGSRNASPPAGRRLVRA